jgi:hemoglobin-like flavoprotein/pimeloyl-ACP methyl ester carboxylesterase
MSALPISGSSQTTAPDAIVGTPRYVAPEIWRGEPANPQTEVYSLGLIAWELLTGRIAHADRHGGALVRAIVDEPLDRVVDLAPGVPASLAAIVDRAVDKQPQGRQASAEQLCTELEQIADSLHALRLLPEPSHARLDDDPVSPDEQRAALVRASLTRVLADGQFGPRFYARLFDHHPELRPLFPATLRDQAIKLADALRLAVSLLRDPPTLEATIAELGARHVLYGVDESQLDHVRDTLVELLGEVEGERMTEALLDAWVWTWGRLDQAFRSGMRRALRHANERVATPMPATRWARCGSTSVAYRTLSGRAALHSASDELDLVVVPSWFAHGELAWRSPEYVRLLAGLAEHARVTVFDRRGTGLSDRPVEPLSLESSLAEISAVLDAIEARAVVLLGLQDGGVLAARFAGMPSRGSERPSLGGRIRGWIGWGLGPRGLPPARVEPLCAAIDRGWGEPLFAELVAPSRAAEPEFRHAWSDLLRNGASPTSAQAMLRFAATLELDTAIATPGLVIHRSEDRWMPIVGAREAAAITGARLVELPGRDHLPWIGDGEAIVTTITEFLTQLPC